MTVWFGDKIYRKYLLRAYNLKEEIKSSKSMQNRLLQWNFFLSKQDDKYEIVLLETLMLTFLIVDHNSINENISLIW